MKPAAPTIRGSRHTPARAWCCLLVWGLICLSASGCVRRRLTIRSNVPGAQVYIDKREIGKTPVSTSYTYYGTREIQLVKDGFDTVTVQRTFDPPWYQYPPLDFLAENLWPWELRDERVVNFELYPQPTVPLEQLQVRAQQMRENAHQGLATPLIEVPPPQPILTPQPQELPASPLPAPQTPSPPPIYRLPSE